MKFTQFSKLEQNIKKTVDLVMKLKFENEKLKKELHEIKERMDNGESIPPDQLYNKLKRLEKENDILIKKQKEAALHIGGVISKVKALTKGVEF